MIEVQYVQAFSMGAHYKHVYKICMIFCVLTNDVMTACNAEWWELLTSNREAVLSFPPHWVAHSVSLMTTSRTQLWAALCYLTVHTGKVPMHNVWLCGIWYTLHATSIVVARYQWDLFEVTSSSWERTPQYYIAFAYSISCHPCCPVEMPTKTH